MNNWQEQNAVKEKRHCSCNISSGSRNSSDSSFPYDQLPRKKKINTLAKLLKIPGDGSESIVEGHTDEHYQGKISSGFAQRVEQK